jgi:hypothetical protein
MEKEIGDRSGGGFVYIDSYQGYIDKQLIIQKCKEELNNKFGVQEEVQFIEGQTIALLKLYPDEAEGGSRWSIWTMALNEGYISLDLYERAQTYYGDLWYYVRE